MFQYIEWNLNSIDFNSTIELNFKNGMQIGEKYIQYLVINVVLKKKKFKHTKSPKHPLHLRLS
jgi:hypothetical protein